MMEESNFRLPSVACAIQDFDAFLSKRAFEEGKAAFAAGSSRVPPNHLGIFSGKWVEGWLDGFYASVDRLKAVESKGAEASLPPQSST